MKEPKVDLVRVAKGPGGQGPARRLHSLHVRYLQDIAFMLSNQNLDQLDTLFRGPVFVPAQLKARERAIECLREEGFRCELTHLAVSRTPGAYYRDHMLKPAADDAPSPLSFSVRWLVAPSGALMVWLVLFVQPAFASRSINVAQELMLTSPSLPQWQQADNPMKALQAHHAQSLQGDPWLKALPETVTAALEELAH